MVAVLAAVAIILAAPGSLSERISQYWPAVLFVVMFSSVTHKYIRSKFRSLVPPPKFNSSAASLEARRKRVIFTVAVASVFLVPALVVLAAGEPPNVQLRQLLEWVGFGGGGIILLGLFRPIKQ